MLLNPLPGKEMGMALTQLDDVTDWKNRCYPWGFVNYLSRLGKSLQLNYLGSCPLNSGQAPCGGLVRHASKQC